MNAGDRKLPNGPASPDCNGVAGLYLSILGRHIPCRKDVGQEQDFFIGKIVLDLQWPNIRERNPHVLRLATGVASHHMRVPEETCARVAISLFHQVSIGIRIVTGSPVFLFAEDAAPASDRKGNNDAISALQVCNLRANLFHEAHEFVSHDVA